MFEPVPEDRRLGRLEAAHLTGVTLLWFRKATERPNPAWFDPRWLERHGALRGSAPGRGTTHFLCLDERELVLRQYRRGGLVRHLIERHYFWTGLRRTRPWCELVVQGALHDQGLPVPRPLGARVQRCVGLAYSADLLTERIPDSRTLADILYEEPLSGERWRRVGEVVAGFHASGLDHADLNGHNILIDDWNNVWLIDFDRARIRASRGAWTQRNVARLRRSLNKLAGLRENFRFTEEDWRHFLDGYGAID